MRSAPSNDKMNMVGDTLNTDTPTILHSITITPQTPGWEDNDLWRERMYVSGKEVRFTCEREMIRDYDKELAYCDGFSYWRTTGRLIVMWYNGSKTIIANKDVAINAKVIECGYDDVLPF